MYTKINAEINVLFLKNVQKEKMLCYTVFLQVSYALQSITTLVFVPAGNSRGK